MKNKIQIFFFSSALILLANCGDSSSSLKDSLINANLLLKFLEPNEKELPSEKKSFIDISGISKDLYGVLYYKEKSRDNQFFENKSQFNFSVAEKTNDDWKPLPSNRKIEINKTYFVEFSLKGVVEIGKVTLEAGKDSKKIKLSSILSSERELKNFKYLVLSLSSTKTKALKIKDSDIEKLRGKKINFRQDFETFIAEPVIEKALEGKTKATLKDIVDYDTDEDTLVKNLTKRLGSIDATHIKGFDGITENADTYPSGIEPPSFNSNPYKN